LRKFNPDEQPRLGRRYVVRGALVGLGALGGTLLLSRLGLRGSRARRSDEEDVLSFLVEHGKLPVTASGDGRWLLEKIFHEDDFELRVVSRATGAVMASVRSLDTQLALAVCPKGRTVAFLACSGGDRRFALYLWDIVTGRVAPTNAPITRSAASLIRWSPDGESLIYTLTADHSRVVIVGRETGQWQVVEPPMAASSEPAWNHDGRQLALVPSEQPGALAIVSLGHPEARPIPLAERGEVRQVSFRPDGRAVAATLRRDDGEYFSLLEVDLLSGQHTVVAELPGDVSEPRYLDSSELLFRVNSGGDVVLMRSRTGRPGAHPVGPNRGQVTMRGGGAEGGRVFVSHVGRTSPPALLEVSTGKEPVVVARMVSTWGSPCLDVEIRSADGLHLPAYLWRSPKEPALGPAVVVLVHGGPALQEMPVWDAKVQVLLRAGFHVLSLNYRGSTGYGARFERAGDNGTRALDVLAACDYCVEDVGVARDRVILLGSSYGTALVTAALVAQPECCRAAVLVSTVSLSRIAPWRLPQSPRVVAFHGANDNVLGPTRARGEIERCLGPLTVAREGTWSVFEHEGHHFHRLSSWARVYSSIIALLNES
jgi:dipeptidyl aminopeptidase/acylaminoacyl peptidase